MSKLTSQIELKNLFDKSYQYLVIKAVRIVYKQDVAEDLVQECFIKLWENCKKVTASKARSFLFKVANNLMLNDIKHQKVVHRFQKTKPKDYTNENPEFLLEKEQYLQQYQKALASLSEEQRVAFTLSKIEGKKHSEIAEMLGVTQKVVEYRIYSAFDKLKTELKGFKIK